MTSASCFFCRVVRGGNGLVDGPALPENLDKVMKKVVEQGFAHQPQVGTDLELDLSCNKDMAMPWCIHLTKHPKCFPITYETFASCHFSKYRSIK